jgi:ammonia channel protein AmtB
VLGITVLTSWGVMWSWIFFYLLKKIKRLKYGEIFEIVGLDNLALNNTDYFLKVGLSKDVIERIEQK